MADEQRRKFWGWGAEGEGPSAEQQAGIAKTLAGRFGVDLGEPVAPPTLGDVELHEPRLAPPSSLEAIC